MKKKFSFSDYLSSETKKLVKKEKIPLFVPPMLATLTEDYFSSDAWIYEPKIDGIRCLAFKKKGDVRLISRNKNELTRAYTSIAAALEKKITPDYILDGEIAALLPSGISSFQALQRQSLESLGKQFPVVYYVFDILHIDGYSTRSLPLYERKKILKQLVPFSKPVLLIPFQVGNGIELFEYMCDQGGEGVIAKKYDSVYVTQRSRDWLKFKCGIDQVLVIGGYTKPRGSRSYFGALLVGYYENNKLLYAGKVGTGFNESTLEIVGKKLEKLRTVKSPFSNYTKAPATVIWVKPILMAHFHFAEWTHDNKLRVGTFKGLVKNNTKKTEKRGMK